MADYFLGTRFFSVCSPLSLLKQKLPKIKLSMRSPKKEFSRKFQDNLPACCLSIFACRCKTPTASGNRFKCFGFHLGAWTGLICLTNLTYPYISGHILQLQISFKYVVYVEYPFGFPVFLCAYPAEWPQQNFQKHPSPRGYVSHLSHWIYYCINVLMHCLGIQAGSCISILICCLAPSAASDGLPSCSEQKTAAFVTSVYIPDRTASASAPGLAGQAACIQQLNCSGTFLLEEQSVCVPESILEGGRVRPSPSPKGTR